MERKVSVATSTSFLAGKKTYLAAIGMVILGVVELSMGDVPQGIQALLAALTAVGLRGAIAGQSQP